MTSFQINCQKADTAASQLSGMKRHISGIQKEIYSVRRNLTSSPMEPVRQKMIHIEKEILGEAAKMDTLVSALEKIVDHYCSSEKMLIGAAEDLRNYSIAIPQSGNIIDDIWEGLRKLWEDIRNIFENAGIIKSRRTITAQQEQEMDIHMQNEIDKILKEERFTEKNWDNASIEEREEILSEFLQRVAAIMGISVKPLKFFDKESKNGYVTYGQYSHKKRQISFNRWVLEKGENSADYLMKVIVHEMRHAYQHAACDNPEQFIVTEETIALWQDSFDNYKTSDGFQKEGMSVNDAHKAYSDQAVERDARSFAKQ